MVPCSFFALMPGERRAHACHARTVKSPSLSGATMNPPFLPPPARSHVNLAVRQNYGHWLHCTDTYRQTLKKPDIHA